MSSDVSGVRRSCDLESCDLLRKRNAVRTFQHMIKYCINILTWQQNVQVHFQFAYAYFIPDRPDASGI